jgi:nicotinamide riboside kinase
MFLLSQQKAKKVSIVAFGGTKSTGKSFLANQFVKNCEPDAGFKLSHM